MCLRACLYTVCTQEPEEVRSAIRSTGAGITDGYKASHGCLVLGPLQEQDVILPAEPSIHP